MHYVEQFDETLMLQLEYNMNGFPYVLELIFYIVTSLLGSRGTRGSQVDGHSSSGNYHDSWESRSSYPDRDRYDSRDQARDSSFERRHGERDRRDNRERGILMHMLHTHRYVLHTHSVCMKVDILYFHLLPLLIHK